MALTRQKIKNLAIYFSYIFIIALISAGVSYFVSDSLKTDKRFGTVTSTGNFPTSLNNFQDDDIINSGDWNHIEYAIGETGTTSPATLTYQVVNTNANNVNYTGKLTITSSTTTNATITNLWTTSFSPTTLTATNGTVTNASTTYATLPTFWSTVGQITNASTTYLSMTDGWLADNPIVSKVAGSQTQLAAFSGTNTITPTSTISISMVNGIGTLASQNANNVSITGGSITGITDLTVADGGTGASTLSGFLYGNGTSAITVTTTPYFNLGFYAGATSTMNGFNICTSNNGACPAGSGTPGGSNTQVQFNDSSAFG